MQALSQVFDISTSLSRCIDLSISRVLLRGPPTCQDPCRAQGPEVSQTPAPPGEISEGMGPPLPPHSLPILQHPRLQLPTLCFPRAGAG